jgi:hypothetical protein
VSQRTQTTSRRISLPSSVTSRYRPIVAHKASSAVARESAGCVNSSGAMSKRPISLLLRRDTSGK